MPPHAPPKHPPKLHWRLQLQNFTSLPAPQTPKIIPHSQNPNSPILHIPPNSPTKNANRTHITNSSTTHSSTSSQFSAMSVIDDKQFFSTYAQLIRLSSAAAPETFHSTEDYHKLTSLGPSLPQLPRGFPKATPAATEATKLSFKSIKPPFKFTAALEVPLDSTVFNIKSELVETVEILKTAGAAPANLKLMLKAKVLTDSTQIGSVAKPNEELAITVMVSPPTTSTETKSPEAPSPSPAAASEDPDEPMLEPSVTEATWAKIGSLLALDIGAERAQKAVAQFRQSL